jgi:hypothetical protein
MTPATCTSPRLLGTRAHSDGALVFDQPVISAGVDFVPVGDERSGLSTPSQAGAAARSDGALVFDQPVFPAGVDFMLVGDQRSGLLPGGASWR